MGGKFFDCLRNY